MSDPDAERSAAKPKRPRDPLRPHYIVIDLIVFALLSGVALVCLPRVVLEHWLGGIGDVDAVTIRLALGNAAQAVLFALGGLIALAGVGVSLSRYRIDARAAEADRQREKSRVSELEGQRKIDAERELRSRFVQTVTLLSEAGKPTTRQAGVYALGALADDWYKFGRADERQVCIDVLCGYLRSRWDPTSSDADGERVARAAGFDLIATRHRAVHGAANWDGAKFNLRGLTIDFDVDFSDCLLQSSTLDMTSLKLHDGGEIRFETSTVAGGKVLLNEAQVEAGSLRFGGLMMKSGLVDFGRAQISGGRIGFEGATFAGGLVDFASANVSGGIVGFESIEAAGGELKFASLRLAGGEVRFSKSHLKDVSLDFREADLTGGTLDFSSVKFERAELDFSAGVVSGSDLIFKEAMIEGGVIGFRTSSITDGSIDFAEAKLRGGVVTFESFGLIHGSLNFGESSLSDGRLTFAEASIFGNGISFDGANIGPRFILEFQDAEFSGAVSNFGSLDVGGASIDLTKAVFSGGTVFMDGDEYS